MTSMNSAAAVVFSFTLLFGLVHKGPALAQEVNARLLIERATRAVGGTDRLQALKDVEYRYTVRNKQTGKKDISIERYIFDGELSWAKYLLHELAVLPKKKGEVIQGFDGTKAWVSLDGVLLSDPQAVRMADFTRKNNFYWFAMMFKLLDPGVTQEYQGTRQVGGIHYDLVRIGFEPGIGDVQDTYLLYLNKETHLVDQFLFSIQDFGITDPFLMRVKYQDVQKVKLPTPREYTKATWKGEVTGQSWTEELMESLKFNNGFDRSLFQQPQP